MVGAHLPFKLRPAQHCIRLFENRDRLKSANVSLLSEGAEGTLENQSSYVTYDERTEPGG